MLGSKVRPLPLLAASLALATLILYSLQPGPGQPPAQEHPVAHPGLELGPGHHAVRGQRHAGRGRRHAGRGRGPQQHLVVAVFASAGF